MPRPIFTTVAVALLSATLLNAATIQIDFQGTVDTIAGAEGLNVSDYIGSNIAVGTPFSGHYLFDSEAEDLGLGLVPDRAVYEFNEAPFEMVVDIGGFTFRTNPSDRFLLTTVANDAPPIGIVPGGDVYTVASARDELVVGTDGLKDFRPEMVLQLIGGNEVHDGVDLLLTPEQHAAFPTSTFSIQGIDPTNEDDSFLIQSGNVVFSSVPEPQSLSLLLFSALLIGRRRRTRSFA